MTPIKCRVLGPHPKLGPQTVRAAGRVRGLARKAHAGLSTSTVFPYRWHLAFCLQRLGTLSRNMLSVERKEHRKAPAMCPSSPPPEQLLGLIHAHGGLHRSPHNRMPGAAEALENLPHTPSPQGDREHLGTFRGPHRKGPVGIRPTRLLHWRHAQAP